MDEKQIKRRLAAILATDAAGCSKHMARDEEGTLRVRSGHRVIIDGLITTFSGRIVGTAGDSVLAEFGSSVDAVRCAVEIQTALATRNAALSDDDRLLFRIGINLGDVIVEGDDILGDGVNVAARLESIAEPGGICVSSSIYDQITGKLNLGFADMGQQSLKDIGRPVRTYMVSRRQPAGSTTLTTPAAPASQAEPARPAARTSEPASTGEAAPPRLAQPQPAIVPAVSAAEPQATASSQPSTPPATPAVAAGAPVVPAAAGPAVAAATRVFTGGTALGACEGDEALTGEGTVRVEGNDLVLLFPPVAGRRAPAVARGPLSDDGGVTLQVVRSGRGRGAAGGSFSGRLVDGRGTLTGPAGGCTVALQLR